MGSKFRTRTKTDKKKLRWKKGQSSSSNPRKTKHRDAAKARLLKSGFGGHKEESETPRGLGSGPARLTAESLLRHDAFMGVSGQAKADENKENSEDVITLGQTHKTFDTFASSVWSDCSNVSFARLLPKFNPSNPKHKEMLAILSAIGEVIAESSANERPSEGDDVSSSEYFGALLSSLDSVDTTEGLSATVALLSIVIKTVDKTLLQAKFSVSAKLLLDLLSRHGQSEDPSVVRGLIGCLSVLLRAQDKEAWAHKSTVVIMDSVLSFVTDTRPKVRKAAQHAVCAILASKDETDDFHPASVGTAKFLVHQIETNAGGSDMRTVLHILILLKEVIYVLPEAQVQSACEAVLKTMTLGNVYGLSCGFQALHGLFSGRPSAKNLSAKLNAKLINALYDFMPSLNDSQPLVAWMTVQQEAHINLGQQDPRLCLDNLPKLFAKVSQCWVSDRAEVTVAATTALKAVINEAIKPNLDIFEGNNAFTSQMKCIFSHIEEGLKYQYHSSWAQVLNLLTVFFDVCGKSYHALTGNCLKTLSELRSSSNFTLTNELDYVVGKAVRTMGPDVVLSHIPLEITGTELTYDFPQSWLLPVLRENVQNAKLAFFKSHFFPMAVACHARSARAAQEGDKVGQKTYEVLVSQIWALLPGFCNNPVDLKESFKGLAQVMGEHLQQRKELRMFILASLRQLILKNLSNEENMPVLARRATNYLPILFNLYTTAPTGSEETGQRLSVMETIKLFVKIADKTLTQKLFDEAFSKYNEKATEVFFKEACHDLIRVLVQYQDDSRLSKIYAVASAELSSSDHKAQKKAYKILEEIAGSERENCKNFLAANLDQVRDVLLGSLSKASPPSQAARLKCLIHIVRSLENDSTEFVYKIVPEAVLCIKAANEKARSSAYTLLVVIGESVMKWRSASEPVQNIIKDYLKVLLAGLAGGPTMIHCTLLAITRIYFEFNDIFPDDLSKMLVENACLLLTSQSREVVGATISFLHVFVTRSLVTDSAKFCEIITQGLCKMSEDCKRHFRLKTRYLFDRLVRKFGYDVVKSIVPKDDVTTQKRLKNIKKIQSRKKRLDDERQNDMDDNSDNEEAEDVNFKIRARPKTMQEILASEAAGEDDNDGGNEEDEDEVGGKKQKRRKKKSTASFIAESAKDDSMVDFLDASAAQKILSSRPKLAPAFGAGESGKASKRFEGDFEIAADGRIIIKDSDDSDTERDKARKRKAGYMLDNSDDEDDNDQNNFGALVSTAQKRKRGTSVASSKKSQPQMKYQAGGSGIHRALDENSKKSAAKVYGSEYKAKKASGDMKRKGKPDPYAYIPLQKSSLNRRKKAKFEGQFQGLVKAANAGSVKGKKAKTLAKKMKQMKV